MSKLLLNHTNETNKEYNDVILEDCFPLEAVLEEFLNEGTKQWKFKAKLQEADAVNSNNRIYPKGILDKNVNALAESIKNGGVLCELDHPNDAIVHLKDASHVIKNLYWEGNNLMGEGVILDTPQGRVFKTLLDNGIRVGISSRGTGNGKVNEDGKLVVGDNYKLISFDAVSEPSTKQAYAQQILESVMIDNNNSLLTEINKLRAELELIKNSRKPEFWEPKSKPVELNKNTKSFLERIRS